MSNHRPDTPELTPMQADAIAMFEVTQSLVAAGFTEEQAFKYIAIRAATAPDVPKCPHCGGLL